MFAFLGRIVRQFFVALIVLWLIGLIGFKVLAPPWKSVVETGELNFLPPDAPSRVATRLYEECWEQPVASTIVIVVQREGRAEGLLESDFEFVKNVLKPELQRIVADEMPRLLGPGRRFSGSFPQTHDDEGTSGTKPGSAAKSDNGSTGSPQRSVPGESAANGSNGRPANARSSTDAPLEYVRAFDDPSVGKLLISDTRQATLLVIDLPTGFRDEKNAPLIDRIEALIGPGGTLERENRVPTGLELFISGSATVGRDMIRAMAESSRSTEKWTFILVITLLVVIYRAPFLAVIPLFTVFVAVSVALSLLAILAGQGWLGLFDGIEVYITVLAYGAGVDYCLFLIARFREEFRKRHESGAAVEESIRMVGAAITASAGTVICGIAMLCFAEFGKFREAGYGITFGLLIVLLAALTLAPALMRVSGRFAFWPRTLQPADMDRRGWVQAQRPLMVWLNEAAVERLWDWIGRRVLARPLTIWLVTVAVMFPFAVACVHFWGTLTYGLISELPATKPSVRGARAIQRHFPPGVIGPARFLVESPSIDFSSPQAQKQLEELCLALRDEKDKLALADVRSIAIPLGFEATPLGTSPLERVRLRVMRKRAEPFYVAPYGPKAGHVTLVECIMSEDPFSRYGIDRITQLESRIRELAGQFLPKDTRLYALGPTAGIRDLKNVTDRDQIRVNSLVLVVVYLILVALLRRPSVCLYLIASVFFSYLVTLGVTFLVFYALDPAGFAGLDWKVPMFLFTILVAVGEDYNIFLMSRIYEERQKHGEVAGVIEGLKRTGSIISSCGIIMAGTFASLISGTLAGLRQLGFALAFGVLLDTFVVRPILVPTWLLIWAKRRQAAEASQTLVQPARPETAAALADPPDEAEATADAEA